MKIGRNEPCPCGSGKKYKKCCIDKAVRQTSNVNTIPIEQEETCFEYIRAISKALIPILSTYDIKDVVRAVFCINSWPNNRSALAQALALNQAIIDTQHFGDQQINDYEAFQNFFNTIATHLPITPLEDPTLSDFGEVKIIFDGEAFPVILGTGHELVFGAMNFLPALATITEMTEETKVVLRYNRLIINTLDDSVSTSGDDYEVKFEVPSPQFWSATSALFASEEFPEHASKANAIVGYQKCPIEMRHFFIHKGDWYPLYNASILVDFYKLLLFHATEEEFYQHIRLTIAELLEGIFNASNTTRSRVLVEPKAIDTETGKPYTNNRLAFMTISGTRVLIAINLGDFTDTSHVMKEIQKITFLHKNNRLGFAETYYRQATGGGYSCEIKRENSIHYLLINPHTDITAKGVFLGTPEDLFSCSALDLIYILGFMDSFDELLEFIGYNSAESASVLAFGGKSSLFLTWKNSHRHIESGAVKYDRVFVQHGTADDYVFTYYTENLFNYPFLIQSKMFFFPLAWQTQTGSHGFTEFRHKGCFERLGEGRMLGPSTFVFLMHDFWSFSQEDFSQQNITLLKTVDELNRRLFDRYADALCALPLLQNTILEVMFTPVPSNDEAATSQLVCSKTHIESNRILLSYSVKLEKLLSEIGDAKDRSVECAYFLRLIEPLKDHHPSLFPGLEEAVRRDATSSKQVDVMVIEQDYYYSSEVSNIVPGPLNFAKARKRIAEICLSAGIKPGIYNGQDATKVVRQMQTMIVSDLEEMLAKYNRGNLHLMTLSYYATQVHGAMMSLKRYRGFRTLEPPVQHEFDDLTKETRENYKRNARTALYLLESNLALDHSEIISQCKESEFADLLALADWLVTLQDNSDVSYFTESDISIEVDEEFKINTILSERAEQQYQEILLRKYDQKEEYGIKNDSCDQDYVRKCIDAFLVDTGVEFMILLSFLEYLQLSVSKEPFATEIHPNVFEAPKKDLVDGFLSYVEDPEQDYPKKVSDVLDFITLNCNNLKNLKGQNHDVLPIWDRENRNNRFEVKPLLDVTDNYIFSPVIMKQLKTLWGDGLLEWYPPFEIGLDSVKRELAKWKKRYEDEMVQDICALFVDAGFDPVHFEIELRSRFPSNNFPDIGDYDVIAINQPRKEMWLIESKVLQKVGSVFEDQMQQKGFFFNNKDDERFQRRIDYIKNNREDIATALQIDLADYTIISYMVTNKLFLSRYKPIDFPIITYHELASILEGYQF